MSFISAFLIFLSVLFTGSTEAPSQALTQAIEAPAQAPEYEFVGDVYEAPTDWVGYELAQADMELPANVFVVLTNDLNCGAEVSAIAQGGCTYTLDSGSYYVTVSPELAWTESGKHVLFHELGHVLNGPDECAAEYYAEQFDTVEMWSYPECSDR